jgi:TusA-related sulfurtransferase
MTTEKNTQGLHANQELDLRGEICPYTFIKSKLILEQMERGAILRVIVDYYPAIRNITKSMKDHGYSVIKSEKLSELDTAIFIQKPDDTE